MMLISESIKTVVFLRYLVGFLGSKPNAGWWDCDFLSQTGLGYLKFIYPRTVALSAFNATVAAALRAHDERIGRGEVFHLFRLPSELESGIMEALKNDQSLIPQAEGKEDALSQLMNFSSGHKLDAAGPIAIGGRDSFFHLDKLKAVAGAYQKAFTDGFQVFPYSIQKDE